MTKDVRTTTRLWAQRRKPIGGGDMRHETITANGHVVARTSEVLTFSSGGEVRAFDLRWWDVETAEQPLQEDDR